MRELRVRVLALVALMGVAAVASEWLRPSYRISEHKPRIALDKQVTVILSQTDHDRPLCGIYFNLHSPYQKKTAGKALKSTGD